jgi:hypothetical protein
VVGADGGAIAAAFEIAAAADIALEIVGFTPDAD